MADKQLSRKQNADGFFADDDPLAALARIASFDPQGETRPKPAMQRREPEFNLEDELLKEFEQYEEPAANVPLLDAGADVPRSQDQPRLADEPAFGDEEPAAAPLIGIEPVAEPEAPQSLPQLQAVPEPSFVGPTEPIRPVSHPVFDLEDEILKEFAAFDARRVMPQAHVEPPVTAPAASQPVPQVAPEAAPVASIEQPVAARVEPAFDEQAEKDVAEAHAARSGYGDEDLISEPEFLPESVSFDALDAMEAEVDPLLWYETKAPIAEEENAAESGDDPEVAIEEPALFEAEPEAAARKRWDDELSNEPAARTEEALETAIDIDAEPEAYLPSDDAMPAEAEILKAEDAQPQAASVEAEPPKAETIPQHAAPATAPIPEARSDDFGLDALLADVERYPISMPVRQPVMQPTVATAAEKPVSQSAPAIEASASVAPDAQPPVAEARAPVEIKVAPVITSVVTPRVEPIIVSKKAEPAAVPTAEPVVESKPDQAATAKAEPVKTESQALPDEEPFDDGAFELDLTEIELDMMEMEVESSVAPSQRQDQVVASQAALADVARATVEEKPVVERSFPPQPQPVEDYSSLPFDPSQIVGEEETVEAIAEMDVPDAPVVDHDIPVPTQPDYDIDIDAEIAHIFSRPTEPEPRAGAAPAKSVQQAPPAMPSMAAADLDEFERALEEDFRRSLSENRQTSTPDRVALTPSAYDEKRREGATGRRILVLAASVAGLVLIGGAGVYAYWGNSGTLLSTSSEPKIILADKDPIKVPPKDRGGQVVPNQDKAVYDAVSGEVKDATKQDRLVSSNEEPVDVVQKTLMPEALPMDEDQASAADAGDNADSRLQPDGQDKNITATEKTVSGVSPRKVRTMVVRSDGTLVPRDDEPAVDDTKQVTPAEASEQRPLDITPAASENVPERLSANDDVAKEIQEANADTKAFVPDVQKPSDVREAQTDQADGSQAVTEDQTAKADDSAAAVADDSAKPADAVPVKKEELPAPVTDNAASSTDTASNTAAADDTAASEAKPADQSALNEAANADVDETAPIRSVTTTKVSNMPIPANRPVDQPVDIVGRVTDQGTVQDTQQVASAEPVKSTDDSQASLPAGTYVIQIASLPSQADAQSSYNKLSAKFASVIGGRGVDIRKASIKNKGTYYRVRIPAGTRAEATDLCARYKAAGGSCLVSK